MTGDPVQIRDLANNTVIPNSQKYNESINQIFSIIDSDLAQNWTGSTYDTFKNVCDSHKESVLELGNVLKEFGDKLVESGDNLEGTINSVNSILG